MKSLFVGQLLSTEHSLFGQALSRTQCLQYALDRPGVLVALAGNFSLSFSENSGKNMTGMKILRSWGRSTGGNML